MKPLLVAVAVALATAACDATPAVSPEPAPTVTVTATEFVPAPEATAPVPPLDACAAFTDGGNFGFVFVTSPVPGTMVQPGFTVHGCSNAFEATHHWRLRDRRGAVLADGFGTATCGTGCVGTFQNVVQYTISQVQVGSLEVFTASGEDGSEQDRNVIPLVLQP